MARLAPPVTGARAIDAIPAMPLIPAVTSAKRAERLDAEDLVALKRYDFRFDLAGLVSEIDFVPHAAAFPTTCAVKSVVAS